MECGLTLGLLISPLSPGVSCSGLCPGTLHAAYPDFIQIAVFSGGDPGVTGSGFLGHRWMVAERNGILRTEGKEVLLSDRISP